MAGIQGRLPELDVARDRQRLPPHRDGPDCGQDGRHRGCGHSAADHPRQVQPARLGRHLVRGRIGSLHPDCARADRDDMSTLSRRLVLAASGATAAFGALIPYGTRAATAVETGPVTSNPELYARFVAARVGTIGTGGAGAVAIRWDHNPDSAIDKGLVDLHREYDIPLTWAHYSQQVEINKGNTHSTSWE